MNIYLRTFAFLKPYWGRLLSASLSASLYSFFSAALIWLIGPLLMALFNLSDLQLGESGADVGALAPLAGDALTNLKESIKSGIENLVRGSTPTDTLFNFCMLTLVIVVCKNGFNYLQGFLMVFATQGMMRDVRDRLFNKYQDLSFDHFHMERTGAMMSRVTNDVTVLNVTLDLGFNRLVADVSLVFMLVGFLVLLSWELTLLAMIALPALFFFIVFIGKKIHKYSGRSQERMEDVTSALEENLSNFRIVKAFGTEAKERAKFHSATDRYFKSQVRMGRIGHLSSPINDTLATVAGLAMLLFAGGSVISGAGQMDASDFLVFIVAMFSLIKPAKSLTQIYARMKEGMAAAERIFKTLDTKPKIKEKQNAVRVDSFNNELRYQNVSFHYPGGPDVLSNVSFRVKRGEVIAFVGPSGGGKSTLVDLLPRFYDPQSGAITIDGTDVRDMTLDSLRSLLGVVTQETYLFNDTIAANISYGVKSCTTAELTAAAKAANAYEFICEFEKGFDTLVGNRGVRLSGGQRQRLAIARALLRNPEILIFDEATSALDTESETLVQEAIDRLMENRTALVVAHRLSTIINADRIYVVANGKVIESGSHEELLAQSGMYQKLHNMQFRNSGQELQSRV